MIGDGLTITVRRFGIRLSTLAIASALCFAPDLESVEFHDCFQQDPNSILLALDAPGQKQWMCLDTGTSTIFFDQAYHEWLTVTDGNQKLDTPSGPIRSANFVTKEFSVAGWKILAGMPAACGSLAKGNEARGYNLIGFLGSSTIAGKILDIDPDQGTVSVVEDWPSIIEKGEYVQWKLVMSGGTPHVTAVVNGMEIFATFDTGAQDELSVLSEDFEKLKASASPPELHTSTSVDLNGTSASPMLSLRNVKVSEFDLNRISCSQSQIASFGFQFIRRFHCVIDLKENFIYLKRSKYFSEYNPPSSWSGLEIHYFHDRPILKVAESSDAYRCGLRSGYRLISINGEQMEIIGSANARRSIGHYAETPVTISAVDINDVKMDFILKILD